MFLSLTTLIAAAALHFAPAPSFQGPQEMPAVPPTLALAGGTSGLLSGTVDFTTSPPQIIATLAGANTGTVKLQLQLGGIADVTSSTNIGNSVFGRGYWSGNASVGFARAVVLYTPTPMVGQRHLFELKWNPTYGLVGGWCLF